MEWLDKVQNLCMNITGQVFHWPDMEEICAQFNIQIAQNKKHKHKKHNSVSVIYCFQHHMP